MAYLESVRNSRYTFRVRPTTRAALIYIKDVLQAILQLLAAPETRLTQRGYNVQALSPTAEELRIAIRSRLPSATIEFDPDAEIADLIDSWPQEFVDASARNDWDWSPQFDLDAMSDDFLGELQR